MTAFWIAHVTITDPAAHAGYQGLAPAAFAAHGARFVAPGGACEVLEVPVLERHVVIAFPTHVVLGEAVDDAGRMPDLPASSGPTGKFPR